MAANINMNGDLSLSGTLGGLRIANPDDEEAVLSPISSAEDDAASSSQRSTSTIRNVAHEPPVVSTSGKSDNLEGHQEYDQPKQEPIYQQPRLEMSQGQYHHPSLAPNEYESFRRTPHDQRPRPSSAMYFHQNSSTSSNSSSRFAGDMMAQQQIGIVRSSSRSASHPLDRNVPTRQPSQRDRYRQSQQLTGPQYTPVNGVVPARRSSRHIAQHPGPHQSSPQIGSPYLVEGGPLPSSEEWKERGAAVSTRQEIDADGNSVSRVIKKGVKDFSFGRTLGEGSYSTVLAGTDRHTGREYAIKVLDKKHIIKEKKVKYVNIEKDTLNRLTEHPGIVRLYYTFQDERSLFFVLDLASAGELLGVLKKTGTFDLECSRFYAAQILDSISYMHSRGVIHRDLKPENVLLDANMHTKITDFGTAKILSLKPEVDGADASGDPMDGADTDRATSFVGTAEYVSPELLTDKNACKASDLWAFGCILFQLLAGRPPFKAANEYLTFQKIVALEYQYPDGFPAVAKDLIQRLLVLDPSKRLPIEHIKNHPFFETIQWGKGLWRMKAPKIKPFVPASTEPIKLNGAGGHIAPNITKPSGTTAAVPSSRDVRPQLRAVTELPPPSQLDIDWSPVLTRHNERILKMGNLIVTSLPLPTSPQPGGADTPKKFSRFFGGGTTKKKQRLVMITSTARIVVVPAGGEEKKAKLELNLVASGVNYKTYQDGRGLTGFCVETRDKQYTFEDPRGSVSDPEGSKYSTQEWIEKIEWAKELAISQSVATSFSADSQYTDMASAIPSPASTAGSEANVDNMPPSHTRNVLRREGDTESLKKKHRFSKRQSKSGLAAVF